MRETAEEGSALEAILNSTCNESEQPQGLSGPDTEWETDFQTSVLLRSPLQLH